MYREERRKDVHVVIETKVQEGGKDRRDGRRDGWVAGYGGM